MLENLGRFFRRNRNNQPPKLLEDARLEELLTHCETLQPSDEYLLHGRFYETLLNCHLLLPVPAGADTRHEIPIVALENQFGERGMPLFTSERSIALWDSDDTDYILLPFPTVCRYAVEAQMDFLLINMAGPYGCEISSYDFNYLAESLLPPPPPEQPGGLPHRKAGEVRVEKNTPMRLSACNGLPASLMDCLGHVFAQHEHLISRVYLFNIAFNEGPLQPALGIRMPEGLESQWDSDLWPNVQAILQEMVERRAVVNVFLLNQAGSMESHVRELTTPIFETSPS